MIKNKKILLYSALVFIVSEAALFAVIHTLGGNAPRYASVVLACLFCILFAARDWNYKLTQIALICTVSADFFLLVLPEMRQLPAMLFFSVTQLAYFLRIYLYDENKTRRVWHIGIRTAASVAAVAAAFIVLGSSADAVAAVSMFYYANLIVNVIFAFIDFKRSPALAVGLLLFALCDAVIGLDLLDGYMTVAADSFIYKIIHPGFDLSWFFYLPAQTLLALSLWKREGESKNKSDHKSFSAALP